MTLMASDKKIMFFKGWCRVSPLTLSNNLVCAGDLSIFDKRKIQWTNNGFVKYFE